MKSLKLALIAAVLAVAIAAPATADEFKAKPKKAVNIVFAKAVLDPGLVVAIYQQVDPGFLGNFQQLYLVKVNYNGAEYRILGSYAQWKYFFSNKWKYLMDKKSAALDNG
jgi:hypothetical protein